MSQSRCSRKTSCFQRFHFNIPIIGTSGAAHLTNPGNNACPYNVPLHELSTMQLEGYLKYQQVPRSLPEERASNRATRSVLRLQTAILRTSKIHFGKESRSEFIYSLMPGIHLFIQSLTFCKRMKRKTMIRGNIGCEKVIKHWWKPQIVVLPSTEWQSQRAYGQRLAGQNPRCQSGEPKHGKTILRTWNRVVSSFSTESVWRMKEKEEK